MRILAVLSLALLGGCQYDYSPATNGTNWGSVKYHEHRLERNGDTHTVVEIRR